MTLVVERIANEIKLLQRQELDEFLTWLAEYELKQFDEWDEEIHNDSQPGGRLQVLLDRVRNDISAGRTKSLDEIINNS